MAGDFSWLKKTGFHDLGGQFLMPPSRQVFTTQADSFLCLPAGGILRLLYAANHSQELVSFLTNLINLIILLLNERRDFFNPLPNHFLVNKIWQHPPDTSGDA